MKFSQLSNEAQQRAVADYIRGWLDSHGHDVTEDDQVFTDDEVRELLLDNDNEDEYSEDGEFIDNNTENR